VKFRAGPKPPAAAAAEEERNAAYSEWRNHANAPVMLLVVNAEFPWKK